jgi:DNA end-binding protein Ku
MPRPIWNGSIAFGLVNVPVRVFTATSQQDVRFHQLRRSDGSRIRQKRVSAVDGTEVPFEEIVKGYEIGPDQYVVVEPDELAALDPKTTQTIDIEEFVSLDQIDPIFYEHAYYLVPDKRAEKAYALLAAAMAESGKVAIARFVMRTKQYLAAVRPAGRVLVLSTMLYADEVVPVDALDGLPDPEEIGISDKELQMAEALIESLTAETFEPEKFHDTYRARVLELIEAKAAGETLVAAPAADTGARVVDLMAALEASVKAAKERRAGGEEATAPAAAKAASRRPAKAAAKAPARAAGTARATGTARAKPEEVASDAAEEEAKPVRSRRRKSA